MVKSTKKILFLRKLLNILKNNDYKEYICWEEGGKAFKILNKTVFSQEVLPIHYKHNKYHSFVRLLNLYKFSRKRNKEGFSIYENKDFFENMTEEDLEKLENKLSKKNKLNKDIIDQLRDHLNKIKTLNENYNSLDRKISLIKMEIKQKQEQEQIKQSKKIFQYQKQYCENINNSQIFKETGDNNNVDNGGMQDSVIQIRPINNPMILLTGSHLQKKQMI